MNAQRQNMRMVLGGPEQIRRIQERAYCIWLQEGRPEGRAEIHWEMARELVAIEDNQLLATKLNGKSGGATGAIQSGRTAVNESEVSTVVDPAPEKTDTNPSRGASSSLRR